MDLKEIIRDVPDFPKAGILFKDITPLLADADASSRDHRTTCATLSQWGCRSRGGNRVAGFIFGTALAPNSAWALCRFATR